MRLRRRRHDEVTTDERHSLAAGGRIRARVADATLLDDAADLVRWLLAHVGFEEGHYGYWPIRVRDGEVWERDDGHAAWVRGVDRAVRTRARQRDTCDQLASDFEPPPASATAIVAAGALERDVVELVRFEYLAPQSGWFLGGERGTRRPLHQLVAERPEMLDFLALEPGWTVRVDRSGARVRRG